MGKRALQPLAAALKLIDQLSDSERAVLYDYLRPERKVKPGKSSSPAPNAAGRSSRKRDDATPSTPNSETSKDVEHPLQANNGRDALVDAYQEALDLAVYLRQAIEEREQRN